MNSVARRGFYLKRLDHHILSQSCVGTSVQHLHEIDAEFSLLIPYPAKNLNEQMGFVVP